MAKSFDVLFSILFHDAPDIIDCMILNIARYCGLNFAVVINVSPSLKSDPRFSTIFEKYSGESNVLFYFSSEDKRKYTFDIGRGHLEAIKSFKGLGFNFDNVVFLASNCLFVKPIPNELFKDDKNSNYLDQSENANPLKNRTESWPTIDFFLNQRDLMIYLYLNRLSLKKQLLEGAIYSAKVVLFLINLLETSPQIFPFGNKVNVDNYPAEEYIFPTINYFLTGNLPTSLIHFDWNATPEVVDRLLQKNSSNSYGLKRVERDPNDPVRQYIKSLY